MSVRVRFAPSPTGPLHIGGLRTALFNYLFARHHGGQFLLRIEDTDQKRFVEGAEDYIAESLSWCGLLPDEGPLNGGPHAPYRQSERSAIYQRYALQLIESGHAYYAFDSEEELEERRVQAEKAGEQPPKYDAQTRMSLQNSLALGAEECKKRLDSGAEYVVRLAVPLSEIIEFEDIIRGQVSFSSDELDDKVLLKADGLPTYHLANVVDDHLMQITHVIRGEEWLSSCPLHVLLYRCFGWERPAFAHLPLILNPNGQGKLSKRSADKLGFPVFPINWTDPGSGDLWSGFRESGFEPEALVNFLALLGWNPGTEQEIFSLHELCQAFGLDRVHKSGARFDIDKARWFNQEHLKAQDDTVLAAKLMLILEERGISFDSGKLPGIVRLLKERVHFLADMPEQGHYFFAEPKSFDEKTLKKKYKSELRPVFERLIQHLESLSDFEPASIEQAFTRFMEQENQGPGALMPVLRLALAGTIQGPPVFEMMSVLGSETTQKRIASSLRRFDQAQ